MSKLITTIKDQNIFDVALQHNGDLDFISEVIRKSTDIGRPFPQGVQIDLPDPDTKLAETFANKGIKISTSKFDFTLSDLDAYFLHYGADDLVLTGDTVEAIRDKSGKNQHLLPLGTKIVKAENSNGFRYLYFDNVISQGYGISLPTKYYLSQPYSKTVVFVVEDQDINADMTLIDGDHADYISQLALIDKGGGDSDVSIEAGGAALAGTDVTVVEGHIYVLHAEFNGANSKVFLDNVQLFSGDVGADAMRGVTLGADYTNGDVARLIRIHDAVIWNGILSSVNRGEVFNYYENKLMI